MKFTVDRFEGELAVLLRSGNEDEQKDVPRKQLPTGVKEGDVIELAFEPDGSVQKAKIQTSETKERKQKAKDLIEKLKNKK